MKNNDDSFWYKDSIIYQVHVRSFNDSNADGVGDFAGLIDKLDYIQFLGVNMIWILPFYPSPLKDDGYDIADYYNVNPIYGSLNDFKKFLREAHKRHIRVMIELVINHTSSEHEWFKKSVVAAPNSYWRNYYVWNNMPERYQEARIIFKDFESSNWSWNPVANSYYWHRFYAHQPDLNFDNKEVLKSIFKIVDFWLNMGVDCLRLDAVPYLYEREGTNCENLPETHDFLKKLRKHVDERFGNCCLLAEANQWPDEAVAYFGEGDECQMAFHFPMMPRMYISIEMEDRFPLVDILQQTPSIPENCQWVTFLRNHDELTLEMVTDEERDYMYQVFAEDPQMRINLGIRRRLSPLMKADRKKIELMNVLLFTLPGTPVIYYGDEIGMGDNIYLGDRNGVRTPMQWNNDLNSGFSKATPQKLFLPLIIDPDYSYEAINVELQKHNDQSLLWWMKRLISLRKKFKAFGRGNIVFLFPENNKILAFLRIYNDEHILIVANLSRFAQYVELDLSDYIGQIPLELFGDTKFPAITSAPYFLTLTPYSSLCFKLTPAEIKSTEADSIYQPTTLHVKNKWDELLNRNDASELEEIFLNYLPSCKWFDEKSQKIYSVTLIDKILISPMPYLSYLLFLDVEFKKDKKSYLLFLTNVEEKKYGYQDIPPLAKIVSESLPKQFLVDALAIPETANALLQLCKRKRRIRGRSIEICVNPIIDLKSMIEKINVQETKLVLEEQSNSSVIYDNCIILKLFRRSEAGVNPEMEIGQFLTQANFSYSPRMIAGIECYRNNKPTTLGIMHDYIPNEGTAWRHTLDTLRIFFDQALAVQLNKNKIILPKNLLAKDIPQEAFSHLGSYSAFAQLLGTRTADLHIALTQHHQTGDFKTEAFTQFDQRALCQSIYTLCRKGFFQLQHNLAQFDDKNKLFLTHLLNSQNDILAFSRKILNKKINCKKTRCHGDYHLGQVLYTGKDVVIIDFEGEPDRSLSERKIKRLPLKDVAGMCRSFHYAVHTVIFEILNRSPDQRDILEAWGLYWYKWVCHLFLNAYLEQIRPYQLLPEEDDLLCLLLRLLMLEKALYEIKYEINHRPTWLIIPCQGILELIGDE